MILLTLLTLAAAAAAYNVTYDRHSFIIDDQRTLLLGGSFHYPRAPPSEWPSILAAMKEEGLNLVQTYVFWDVHEPTEGTYNFPTDDLTDKNNLVHFLNLCKEAGLYVHLRVGPYACAEWNNGGFPHWLRKPGVVWRTATDDDYFITKMENFLDKTLAIVDDANLFAKDDGPVILAQIENEYGDVEFAYGDDGASYVEKIGNYAIAKSEEIEIPWIMCKQGAGSVGTTPPAGIISSTNGYYGDDFIAPHTDAAPNDPHAWTENWPGWFQMWGESKPHRPATDVSFSVARFILQGGSFMNYYMAFGGTTFGRSVGGPNIITSYDYDVMINEYGFKAQPKYDLLAALHNALYEVAQVLFSMDPPPPVPVDGFDNCETHSYTSGDECVTFVSNIESKGGKDDCVFNGFSVPSWSVSILTGCNGNAELLHSTKDSVIISKFNTLTATNLNVEMTSTKVTNTESIPPKNVPTTTSSFPLEQFNVTLDATDYLWYTSTYNSAYEATDGVVEFTAATSAGLCFYLFSNTQLVDSQCGGSSNLFTSLVTFKDVVLAAGDNEVTILSVGMGVKNYGAHLERSRAGVVGDVLVNGFVVEGWTHSVGLEGADGGERVDATADDSMFTWYELKFTTPALDAAAGLAVDMTSMGKGMVSVNGVMLGRYWSIVGEIEDDCKPCDLATYSGSYSNQICRSGCGEPSQSYYKLPVSWLRDEGDENVIVIFEEIGGDVGGVGLVKMTME